MAYGTRASVIEMLGLTGTRFNDKVDEYLDKASEYVDNELRPWVSVPLSSVPALINQVTNDLAAGMYREDQLGSTGQQVLTDPAVKRAKEALASYIAGQYAGKGPGQGGRRKGLFRKVYYVTGDEDGGVNL